MLSKYVRKFNLDILTQNNEDQTIINHQIVSTGLIYAHQTQIIIEHTFNGAI